MRHSRRLANLPPYPFARWADQVSRAQESGLDVIRLDIGNPDLPPAEAVVEALCRSARQPEHHGYPGYRGTPALRRAIADYYDRRFDVCLDPTTEVLPLIGSKEGLVNLALAFLDPGDVALVPDPGYAPYSRGAVLAGGRIYPFPLLPERGYLPDLDAIPSDTATKARLMWLNYPNNPTGATADLDLFARAVDFARRHELLLCHDAPYSDVTYDGYQAPSVLQVPGALEVTVEFNSLSKLSNMAGWRIGMAVGNTEALRALARVKSNVDSGIFHPLQEAAVAALAALSADPDWLLGRNAVYRDRLELLVEGWHHIGLEASRPQATLYLWGRIPGLPSGGAPVPGTSESFAEMLLNEAGIAVAPGSFFGESGEGFIRVSATAPTAQIREAVRRLRALDAPTPQSGS
ncbi:MAG: aminotransferase class I/II-fold pyridoxal phosphate-dependent enzyme [Chloroflexota bacterium]